MLDDEGQERVLILDGAAEMRSLLSGPGIGTAGLALYRSSLGQLPMERWRRSLAGWDSLSMILTRDRGMGVLVPANPVTAPYTVIRQAISKI